MTRRNYALGLALLCALVLGAIAASSAAAEQRAYTCSTGAGTKEFSDAHCLTKGEAKEFGHNLISKENAKFTITNSKTASGTTAATVTKLKSTLSGVETEIQCTNLGGSGQLTNAEASVTGTAIVASSTFACCARSGVAASAVVSTRLAIRINLWRIVGPPSTVTSPEFC